MPVRVQIDGVGTVELDDAFRTKTPTEQSAIVDKIKTSAPRQGFAHNMVRSLNVGAANVLGAPVDLATAAVNTAADFITDKRPSVPGPLGLPIRLGQRQSSEPWIKNPVGGSQWIKGVQNAPGQMLGAGDKAAAYDDLSELPPSHRPFAVAGETFSGSVIPGLGGMTALQRAKNVPQALQPMAEFAKRSPRAFMASELAGASGSAQGAAIAEMAAPGDPTARFVGDVAGGFVSPTSLLTRAYRTLSGVGKQAAGRVLPSVTRAGAQREAADIVQRVVREAGEDPAALSRTLFTADPDRLRLTPGQRTGSQALLNLEAKLAESRPSVGAAADTMRTDALGQLRETADVLAATKNPGALKAAAALRKQYFDDILDARISQAVRDSQDARYAIAGGGGTRSQMDASQAASDALDAAWNDARSIEREMWAAVPSNRPATVENVLQAYKRSRSELLPNDRLREPIEGYLRILSGETPETVSIEYPDGTVKSIGGKGYQPTTGDLKNLRSRALSLERQAAQQGDRTTERHMGLIARAALDDLSGMDLPGLQEAREYSQSLHNAFTKTFAGDVLAVTREGAERIPAQLALERAYGSGGAGAALRMRELQDATEFPAGVRADAGPQMAEAQQSFLRAQANRMASPETGAFDPNQLHRFRSENAPLLQRFPELTGEIDTLTGAERNLARTRAVAGSRQERVGKVLGSVLRSEDPARTVADALRGRNPTRDYSSLANIARKGGGADALSGLRAATLRHTLDSATTQAGKFSFQRFSDALRGPMAGSKESVLDLMKRSVVISKGAADNLDALISRGIELERAIGDPREIERLYRAPDMFLDFAARTIGANVGARFSQGTGAPLVAAARGSRLAREWIHKIPLARTSDVLVEAVENPKLMAALLARPKSVGDRAAYGQIIHGFLVNAGIIAATEDQRERAYAQ